MKALKIGNLLAPVPIVQGGMGVGISLAGLASAVADQGGIGVISSAGLGVIYKDYSKDYRTASIWGLKQELKKAREATKGIVGVNVMVAMSNFADMVRTAIAEKADIIFSGAGLPLNLPSFLTEGAKTKLAPIVSSARAAKLLCQKWFAEYKYIPDAIVVEGPKAGGHLGYKEEQLVDEHYALESIVPEIVAEVHAFEAEHGCHIPVIAGGGIYTGEDIYRIMSLGAEGVQMGTRFVTTDECDADPAFKQSYLDATQQDIEIIKSPVGMPGRAIQELPVRLHQDVRRDAQPLLHHAGALQRLQGKIAERLCLLRRQRMAGRKDPVGARSDGFAQSRVRQFFAEGKTLRRKIIRSPENPGMPGGKKAPDLSRSGAFVLSRTGRMLSRNTRERSRIDRCPPEITAGGLPAQC